MMDVIEATFGEMKIVCMGRLNRYVYVLIGPGGLISLRKSSP